MLIIGCTIGTWLAVLMYWWLLRGHIKAMQEHQNIIKDFHYFGEIENDYEEGSTACNVRRSS